jgi:hypothetical protein
MTGSSNKRTIRVFYAWQSDLPKKFNRYAIKKGLRLASAEIEHQISSTAQAIELIIDEATRDAPGSPNIPLSILGKIQLADVFVADVSITNDGPNSQGTPNPNVVFELGFAVGHLGWERIILLVNEVHGGVELLPFDFDRHRAMTFKLGDGIGTEKLLASHLRDAISLIIAKDPSRPRTNVFDPAQTERERDLTNLRRLLGSIHWPTIKEHISIGPKYLTIASDTFHDEVTAILSSPLFHIYDAELKERIMDFFNHWSGSIEYDQYEILPNRSRYVWRSGLPSRRFRESMELAHMETERVKMHSAMKEFIALIRAKFPEIDLQELSQAVADRYNAGIANGEQRLTKPNPLLKIAEKK